MEQLTKETFALKVKEEKRTCLVLFGKETCPVCQEVHPLLEEIEEGYQERPFAFYYVDANEESEMFKDMGMRGVPYTLFFKQGEEIQRFSGAREYEEYEFFIDRIMEED